MTISVLRVRAPIRSGFAERRARQIRQSGYDAPMSTERDIALSILRTATAGAETTAQFVSDPVVRGVAQGVGGLLSVVSTLVAEVGVSKAKGILERLIADPAKPLTDADLDANVARVKRELGL